MNENYETVAVTDETMRNDLVELLTYLKQEVISAPTSVIVKSEDGKEIKRSSSEFSQRVEAYDKIYKLYLADIDQEFDRYIKDAERERKNCEYLEDTDHKNKEIGLKSRDLDIKERELDAREISAKESGKWWNKPIAQTALICGTTLIVNGVAIYLNASETPLKSIFEKWMIRPRM
jgi:hypothetical protein